MPSGRAYLTCRKCGDFMYQCMRCRRWVCPNCPPIPFDNAWGFGCPHCGAYWSVYYDPPDGMDGEEWEKEFRRRLPQDFEIYERTKPAR